jgi:hypothetical protein
MLLSGAYAVLTQRNETPPHAEQTLNRIAAIRVMARPIIVVPAKRPKGAPSRDP